MEHGFQRIYYNKWSLIFNKKFVGFFGGGYLVASQAQVFATQFLKFKTKTLSDHLYLFKFAGLYPN